MPGVQGFHLLQHVSKFRKLNIHRAAHYLACPGMSKPMMPCPLAIHQGIPGGHVVAIPRHGANPVLPRTWLAWGALGHAPSRLPWVGLSWGILAVVVC